MAYRVGSDLWFCRFGHSLIFLDVHEDRYFQLPASQARSFISRIAGRRTSDSRVAPAHTSVEESTPSDPRLELRTIKSPTRSALEHHSLQPRLRPGLTLEVSTALFSTFLQLKVRSLQDVLSGMLRCKDKCTSTPNPPAHDLHELQAMEAARSFSRARLLVPIEPSCLLDSIALSNFLARRGMDSSLVFGVTCNPFSAHSWVQVSDIVLNDSVGSARSYTPIGIF